MADTYYGANTADWSGTDAASSSSGGGWLNSITALLGAGAQTYSALNASSNAADIAKANAAAATATANANASTAGKLMSYLPMILGAGAVVLVLVLFLRRK